MTLRSALALVGLGLISLGFSQGSKELEAMMRAGQPGPQHRMLSQYAGNWKATVHYVIAARPFVAHAKMHAEMVMGGRFLKLDYRSSVDRQALEVVEYWGFDTTSGEYTETILDNSSTGIRTARGLMEEGTRSITTLTDYPEPGTGKPMKLRIVTAFTDKKHFTVEWFQRVEGKDEERVVWIENVRA